ncbi:oxygen-independent coproporphyrinogen III oxidase [Rhizobium sp. 768_B6_N1_8]|uniref:oxygen-independent coproporphyrinogen III oxidase n=1 Tax=unclassified Rhizobium TaxID=2613769 RepID=UPI003F1F5F17
MKTDLLKKYSGPVPRYTSYPTAPQLNASIGAGEYALWLDEIAPGTAVSLYVHIPYCDRLCWFCACHTKQTLRYEPIAAYLRSLKDEIDMVAQLIPEARITALHLGGGSPTMLKPGDMIGLIGHLKTRFRFEADASISVEMDPNDLDEARYEALAEIGLTRASLGVQDFDPVVQQAINRLQTFEQTRGVVDAVRARGVRSVNCDLLYGLPHQTLASLECTVSNIVTLDPDRIALFGYAHVPWMKKHQTMIPEETLPDAAERFRQMGHAAAMLCAAGYQSVGIDHFARVDDGLAVAAREGRLHRNFQGYTEDEAPVLIGLGASSIGRLPQGYVQNMPATGEYQRMVDAGGLAVVRGIALSDDDRLRGHVIERLMCDFRFSFRDLRAKFGAAAEPLITEARQIAALDQDGLCAVEADGFCVTETAKVFSRVVSSWFDAHLGQAKGRHSIAV